MTTSIIAIAIIAAIAGSYTIVKSRRAAAAAIEGLFDEVSRTATCVKHYSMSIDSRYRKKNHLHTYSKDGLLMESFATCSLNDSTDEIEKEIQIFITKDEHLCVFSIKDTASNRRILKTL